MKIYYIVGKFMVAMRTRSFKYYLSVFFFFIFVNSYSFEKKNILCINSYHVGYHWTDSIVSGITSLFEEHPEYNIYIECLDAKKNGQSKFDIYKAYYEEKYASVKFEGIILTDNDALDFGIKFGHELFPEIPITFCGISNPEDYDFTNSRFYGILENNDPEVIINTIRTIVPERKKILVLTDNTTSGIVYTKEYQAIEQKLTKITLSCINKIDPDSIIYQINSGHWNTIFLHSLDRDKYGNLINYYELADSIIKACPVPIFTNNEFLVGKGVVGGPVIKGSSQGRDVAKLLLSLLDHQSLHKEQHIHPSYIDYIFDRIVLDRYNIRESHIPDNSTIINNKPIKNLRSILILSGASMFLLIIVFILIFSINRRTKAEKKTKEQLAEIQMQHIQLEEAFEQLNKMMGNMETVNAQLKQSNDELLSAKKKAEESDALKSAFLANVSHEIRTPLNAIVGFSSLLEDESLDDITRNEFIGYVSTNTATLLVLIDQILDLSKIEANQLEIQKDWFSVDGLLNDIKESLENEGNNTNVELKINPFIPGKNLFIKSDKIRMAQIFKNLVSNSYKFTEEGSIEIGAYIDEKKGAVFYVKDTGIGIDPEFQDVIFDRFRKLESPARKVYRGTGLGLSITKKLVELLGGEIWLDTKYTNGSAFYFTQSKYEER